MLQMPHSQAINKDVTQLLWLDLRDLVKQVHFSNSEYLVLGLYSLGYTYQEIGDRYRRNNGKLHPVTEQYINLILHDLFKRIAKQNSDNIMKRIKKYHHIK